jgi:hypothetical protein
LETAQEALPALHRSAALALAQTALAQTALAQTALAQTALAQMRLQAAPSAEPHR